MGIALIGVMLCIPAIRALGRAPKDAPAPATAATQ